jgi:hypothetical protein
MPEEDKDVKDTEESSAEEEELTEEELETEEETEETKESEEETEETKEETEDEKPEVKPEEESEKLKLQEQVHNLTIALQEKRKAERASVTAPVVQPTPVLDTKAYVEAMIKGEEQAAFEDVYKKYPQYAPVNDPDNSRYNQLIQDMVMGAKVRGVVPTKKEQFLDLAETALAFRGEKTTEVGTATAKARTEAHAEHLKAEAANIGGTSVASKKREEVVASEADRRAAKAANMDLKAYMKNKDVYGDGLPL